MKNRNKALNLSISKGCNRESQLCKSKAAETSDKDTQGWVTAQTPESCGRQLQGWTSFYNDKKAFTLIELLVVVLIIGVLAAIAVPQYQVSVDKARYMEMLTTSKSLASSIEVYYMANGNYPAYWNKLDIGIEGCTETNISKYLLTCKKFTIDLNDENFIAIPSEGLSVRLWYYFGNGSLGRFMCNASNTRGNRVCKSMCGRAECYLN